MVKCESLRMNMYRITHTGKVSKFSRDNTGKKLQKLKQHVMFDSCANRVNWLP